MTHYTIATPPNHAGIYALKNRITGHVYVGKSENLRIRLTAWRAAFREGSDMGNLEFQKIIRATHAADWEFRVLVIVHDMTKLAALERRAIDLISRTKSDLCLNHCLRAKQVCVSQNNSKSIVLGPKGEMTHRQAADALGVRRETVRERVRYWRRKGITQLKLEDLMPKAKTP